MVDESSLASSVRMDLRSEMNRLRDPVTFTQWTAEMALGIHRPGMRLLKLRDLHELVGLKSSQIYRLIEQGDFPAPVPLTKNARPWPVHEIEEWLRGRVALSLKISGQRTVRRSRNADRRRDNDRRSA